MTGLKLLKSYSNFSQKVNRYKRDMGQFAIAMERVVTCKLEEPAKLLLPRRTSSFFESKKLLKSGSNKTSAGHEE